MEPEPPSSAPSVYRPDAGPRRSFSEPELERLLDLPPEAARTALREAFRRGAAAPVVDLLAARRARTLARLAGEPCPVHGAVEWHVNRRGDAWCPRCFPAAEVNP